MFQSTSDHIQLNLMNTERYSLPSNVFTYKKNGSVSIETNFECLFMLLNVSFFVNYHSKIHFQIFSENSVKVIP